MAECTEHHVGSRAETHPADIVKEIVPVQVWEAIKDALMVGNKDNGRDLALYWDLGFDQYAEKVSRHASQLAEGQQWDRDDGQHHAAAVVIRGFQMLAKDLCPEGG